MPLVEDVAKEIERWAKMEKKGLSQASGRKEAATLFGAWVAMYVKSHGGEEPESSVCEVYLNKLKDSFDRLYAVCADADIGLRYLAGAVEVTHMLRYFVKNRGKR